MSESGQNQEAHQVRAKDLRIRQIVKWQRKLWREYDLGRIVRFEQLSEHLATAFTQEPSLPGDGDQSFDFRCHGMLPNVRAVVVGIDIREYSRRSAEQQLFLTVSLHACIRLTVELLRSASLVPILEPRIIVQTGDGAYVVFTFLESRERKRVDRLGNQIRKKFAQMIVSAPAGLERANLRLDDYFDATELTRVRKKVQAIDQALADEAANYLPETAAQAFSFIFTLNAILHRNNVTQRFITGRGLGGKDRKDHPTFPVECRFAVSYGNVLLLEDILGNLNCVGKGMVTCARILSTDHGSHLLVDEELLRAYKQFGGLNSISGGQWRQELHEAMLPDVKVKSGDFRYADIFGFYEDEFLLRKLGQLRQNSHRYHIGSHDVGSLDD